MSNVHLESSLIPPPMRAGGISLWTRLRRPTFLGLALAMCALSGCAQRHYHDPWLGADKFKHLAVGTVVGTGSTYAAREAGASIGDARIIGVTVVMTLGAGKEFYDQEVKQTFFSWRDMTWNLIGAALGAALVQE